MLDISNWDKKVRKRRRNGSQPGGRSARRVPRKNSRLAAIMWR